MPEFKVGDKVKVVEHLKAEYIEMEGVIFATHPAFSGSGPIGPRGEFPATVERTLYDIEIEPHPYHLTRLEEEWLELIPPPTVDNADSEC